MSGTTQLPQSTAWAVSTELSPHSYIRCCSASHTAPRKPISKLTIPSSTPFPLWAEPRRKDRHSLHTSLPASGSPSPSPRSCRRDLGGHARDGAPPALKESQGQAEKGLHQSAPSPVLGLARWASATPFTSRQRTLPPPSHTGRDEAPPPARGRSGLGRGRHVVYLPCQGLV